MLMMLQLTDAMRNIQLGSQQQQQQSHPPQLNANQMDHMAAFSFNDPPQMQFSSLGNGMTAQFSSNSQPFDAMPVTPTQAVAQLAAVANLNPEMLATPQQAKAELDKIELRRMFLVKFMEATNLKRVEMINSRPPNIDPATFEAQLGGLNIQSLRLNQIALRIGQVKAQVAQRLQMLLIQEQQQGGPMATPIMLHQPGPFNAMPVTPAQAIAQLAAITNLNPETLTTSQQAKAELAKIEHRRMFLVKSIVTIDQKRAEVINSRPPNIDSAVFEAQVGGLTNQLQKFQQMAARFDQVEALVGQRLQTLLSQEQQLDDDPADMYVPLSMRYQQEFLIQSL